MLDTLDTLFRFVSFLMQAVISCEPIPHEYVKIPFRCRVTQGANRPNESKQLFCIAWNDIFIRTLLPPISHHHVAPHPTQPSELHTFLTLSIACTSDHFIFMCARSSILSGFLGCGGVMEEITTFSNPHRTEDWRFEQAPRMELLRAEERDRRQHWFRVQREKLEGPCHLETFEIHGILIIGLHGPVCAGGHIPLFLQSQCE